MSAHIYFGLALWRQRESRGLSSKVMAAKLKLSLKDYQKLEKGLLKPSEALLKKITQHLKFDPKPFLKKGGTKNGAAHKDKHKVSDLPVSIINSLKTSFQSYQNKTGKTVSPMQIKQIEQGLKECLKPKPLSLLPVHFILVAQTLLSPQAVSFKTLGAYKPFMTKHESLAGFLSRDMILGPYLYQAACLIQDKRFVFGSIEKTLERLTFKQFKFILLALGLSAGFFDKPHLLPTLVEHTEFSGLACQFVKMTQLLTDKNPLPDIDFETLYLATLWQGMGQSLLFEHVYPLLDHNENTESFEESVPLTLFNELIWGCHAALSAEKAKLFGNPPEVLKILYDHHKHPVRELSPSTAFLKIINFFVDKDFPKISKSDLEGLLKAYPQVKIKPDLLFGVCVCLSELKAEFFERSSTLIQDNLFQLEASSSKEPKHAHIVKEGQVEMNLDRNDVRFSQNAQASLLKLAETLLKDLAKSILTLNSNESPEAFLMRQKVWGVLQILLKENSLKNTAKRLKISENEILALLDTLK